MKQWWFGLLEHTSTKRTTKNNIQCKTYNVLIIITYKTARNREMVAHNGILFLQSSNCTFCKGILNQTRSKWYRNRQTQTYFLPFQITFLLLHPLEEFLRMIVPILSARRKLIRTGLASTSTDEFTEVNWTSCNVELPKSIPRRKQNVISYPGLLPF